LITLGDSEWKLNKNVCETITRPKNWTIAKEILTIVFPESMSNSFNNCIFHLLNERLNQNQYFKGCKAVKLSQFKLSVWESLKLFKMRNENVANLYKEGNLPSIL
jgi:hypothetical protein